MIGNTTVSTLHARRMYAHTRPRMWRSQTTKFTLLWLWLWHTVQIYKKKTNSLNGATVEAKCECKRYRIGTRRPTSERAEYKNKMKWMQTISDYVPMPFAITPNTYNILALHVHIHLNHAHTHTRTHATALYSHVHKYLFTNRFYLLYFSCEQWCAMIHTQNRNGRIERREIVSERREGREQSASLAFMKRVKSHQIRVDGTMQFLKRPNCTMAWIIVYSRTFEHWYMVHDTANALCLCTCAIVTWPLIIMCAHLDCNT